MKIVALVPFWEQYENNEFRMRKISGRYMLSYALEKLNGVEGIDNVYIYSSNDNFTKYLEQDTKYTYLKRPELLDTSNTTIEMIIHNFLLEVDADVVVLLHPTSPLLKLSSIQKCLNNVKDGKFDSSFTAVKHEKFSWYKNKPLNYNLNEDIPNLNLIEPIYVEQASLYIFKKDLFAGNIDGLNYLSQIQSKIILKLLINFDILNQ